jgi:pilus assembly protein CpaB
VKKDKPSVARAVTLEVSPTQAQKLALAATVGTLSLALRNITNADDVAVRPVGLRDLGVGEVVAPKPAPAPVAKRAIPMAQVRVYRGTKETSMEVHRD